MTATRRSVVAAVLGVAALVTALVGGGALTAPTSAAAATAPRLMVSDDGEHWQGRLDSALFGDDLRLVPGASATGTFWVKNLSSEPATLTARLVDVTTSSPAFAEAVTVSSRSDLDVGALPPVTLAGDGCTRVLAPLRLAAGREVPVTVSVALAESAADGTGGQTLDFGVLVTLTGLAGAAVPADCAPTGTAAPADSAGSVETSAGGAGGGGVSSATIEAVTTRASSAAGAGGAASSGGGPAGVGGTELPLHALDALDDFVPVPLRGTWLPLMIAAIAVSSGAFVAVGRRRPTEDDRASDDPARQRP
ncbi:hypothetical protein [Frigoribacterium sp. VKM Ac-2836]|uniref:hypothetical protein n=1 Tax=Frigoribacterium sp. VKM Ac-2836 TaxID=2739014 RepID=UPI0015664F0C|nr:hypothetical protein [Frigoribacterium sp. VKM Ac-2836]NRD25582.1 hypothetical protein [Frigoribacterium sp. VKM Ac-2836]